MTTNAPLAPSWASPDLAVCRFSTRSWAGPEALANRRQVHGATVHVLPSTPDGRAPEPPEQGDGIWTDHPGLAIAIRIADCVPILLWDPVARAVAAVHAGWRGTAADIAGTAVRVGARLGVQPARLHAAIGPCISGARFEVGPDVVNALRAVGLTDDQLGLHTGPRGRPHVDLRRANRALLIRAGLSDARIEDVGGCTYDQPDVHHSWRRDGSAAGRDRAIIALASS